jgi:hypothetical protein
VAFILVSIRTRGLAKCLRLESIIDSVVYFPSGLLSRQTILARLVHELVTMSADGAIIRTDDGEISHLDIFALLQILNS